MSDYTTTEISSAFGTHGSWGDLAAQEDGHKVALPLGGEAVLGEKVASDNADNEEGGQIFVVLKVGSQFFRKTGYYASHYGSEWDGPVTEVRPVQKYVTAWDAV